MLWCLIGSRLVMLEYIGETERDRERERGDVT